MYSGNSVFVPAGKRNICDPRPDVHKVAREYLFLPAADILRVGRAVLFRTDLFPVVVVPSNNRST
jgi:hypothetical protein